MKCPKCGYHSFDSLENCRKCNQDLSDHKSKFNLRGFFSPPQAATLGAVAAATGEGAPAAKPDSGDVDFGFDFLDEEEPNFEKLAAVDDFELDLGADSKNLNIAQPFKVDGEAAPAGKPPGKSAKSDDNDFEL